MKLAIVLYSEDPEIVWNALRLAIFSRKQGDDVKIFLLEKGVEIFDLHSEKYNITQLVQEFVDDGGDVMSCTTCVKSRNMKTNELCPLVTLNDLYSLIKTSDKVLSF